MKVGDRIVWFVNADDAPENLLEGTITRIIEDVCWVDNNHRPADGIYTPYCWPARVREELTAILVERNRLKKAFYNSMELVYQLRDAVTRGEK